MKHSNLHIDTNVDNTFCITKIFSDNDFYYKKYNYKYFFSKEYNILLYILKNINISNQQYFQRINLEKTNYEDNIIVTEKINGIPLSILFNKNILSHIRINYFDDDITILNKLNNKKFLEYYCYEIIKLLKIMANNFIYEVDTNFNNYIINNNKLIKIDFGGINKNYESELYSKYLINIDNLLNDNSIFKKKLFTETKTEIINLFNILHLEDTGIYKPLNNKYCVLTKKILYYFMFTKLEKKIIEYTLEYKEINEFKLLTTLYNEYINPSIY